MIGAVVYKLRAEKTTLLPLVHGKWLHAVLFHEMAKYSGELADRLHGENAIKPFSLSELMFADEPKARDRQQNFRGERCWHIAKGERVYWRVSGLNEEIVRFLLQLPTGIELRIKDAVFTLEEMIADSNRRNDAGLLDERELILHCLNVEAVSSITFRFLSPVSFRVDTQDIPLPKPELIFGSIADKWNQNKMPIPVSRNDISDLAGYCDLTDWNGKSSRRFYGAKHGINGFEGRFTYDLRLLNENDKRLLLLLAQFSVFSGVGRLTGQGMGQTRVSYR